MSVLGVRQSRCAAHPEISIFQHRARSNNDVFQQMVRSNNDVFQFFQFSQAPILISRMENMCWAQAVWWIHIQAECQLSWQRRAEQFAAPVVSDKCYPPVIALVLT